MPALVTARAAARSRLVVNLLVFQLGWAVCVLGGSLAAVMYALPALVLHFAWVTDNPREWRFILAAAGLGIALDMLALHCGIFAFTGSAVYPVWMVVLWALFATLVPHGLAWLQGRWLTAVLLGAVGGAGSYAAGAGLGVARTPSPALAYSWWAVQWGLLLPALLMLARRNSDLSSHSRVQGQ